MDQLDIYSSPTPNEVGLHRRRSDGRLALVLPLGPRRGALVFWVYPYQRLDRLLEEARNRQMRQHGDPDDELWQGVEALPWHGGEGWEAVEPQEMMLFSFVEGEEEDEALEEGLG